MLVMAITERLVIIACVRYNLVFFIPEFVITEAFKIRFAFFNWSENLCFFFLSQIEAC